MSDSHTRLRRAWRLKPSQFVRNVAVVAGGAAGAQAIGVLASPVVTRLYGPNVYGLLATFVSTVAVFSSIASLSYALAIVLPKRDVSAYQLLIISAAASLFVASIVAIGVLLAGPWMVAVSSRQPILSYLWLLPVGVLFTSLILTFEQWHVRAGSFRVLSGTAIINAALAAVTRITGGVIAPSATVLIGAGVFAQIVQAALMFRAARPAITRQRRPAMSRRRKRAVACALARRYRDFPIYRMPQLFLNTISRAAPVLLLASYFGPAAAGFYGLAQTVLNLPLTLVAQSIGKVFLQDLASRAHKGQPIRPVIVRTTLVLTLLGVIPFAFVGFAGPPVFGTVFGDEWRAAGEYGRWLAIWVFFHFINIPAVQSLSITQSQRLLMVWEVAATGVKVGALALVAETSGDPLYTVAVYSVVGAIAYLVLIAAGIIRAGDRARIRAL